MSSMTDPADALRSFQDEVSKGTLSLRVGELDPTLFVHLDKPNGVLRLSYAFLSGRSVSAFACFVQSDPYEGLQCFQVGYAVPMEYRKQGRGRTILRAAIAEMRHGFARTPIKAFFIEAVVGKTNIASQRIAGDVIGPYDREIMDEISGEPAFFYIGKFETAKPR